MTYIQYCRICGIQYPDRNLCPDCAYRIAQIALNKGVITQKEKDKLKREITEARAAAAREKNIKFCSRRKILRKKGQQSDCDHNHKYHAKRQSWKCSKCGDEFF